MNKLFSTSRLIDFKIIKSILIILSFSFFISIKVDAQEIRFYEIGKELSKTSEIINDKEIDIVQLESLIYNLNSTIYLANNIKKVYGTGDAVVLDSDAQSINELYKSNSAFNQIEIIRLNLNTKNDLSLDLNVDKLSSFYRLKYIFVEFTFDVCENRTNSCLTSKIKNLITGEDSNVIVIYKLSVPN